METQVTNNETSKKFSDDAWQALMTYLVTEFKPGEIIAHETLKEKLIIRRPHIDDYETVEDYDKAKELVQFEYMALVDKLRWDILESHKYYLKSERGLGYLFLPPRDQVAYAYKSMIKEIKKAFKEGIMIASYRHNVASQKDTDTLNTMGTLKRLFSGFLKP